MVTLLYLPSTECAVVDPELAAVCGATPTFLIIEDNGSYTLVCDRHIATGPDGTLLAAFDPVPMERRSRKR